MSTATVTDRSVEANGHRLTETLEEKLSHPATSPDFDLKKGVNRPITPSLPPKADIVQHDDNVRFVPKADIGLLTRSPARTAGWRMGNAQQSFSGMSCRCYRAFEI
jgi:hypothetical protein